LESSVVVVLDQIYAAGHDDHRRGNCNFKCSFECSLCADVLCGEWGWRGGWGQDRGCACPRRPPRYGGQTPLLHFLLESSILGSLQTTLKQGFQSTYIRPGMPSNHGCPQLHTVAKTFTLKAYDVLSTSNTYKVYYGYICSVF